jgi:6-pyruvoyltetrahydropterin/6-carboxytetrahydropterin synthase
MKKPQDHQPKAQDVKYRDAVTGEYVTAEYAKANPDTTVKEADYVEPEDTGIRVTLPFYTISKEFAFSASHQLDGLPEDHQCSRLHGHNYVIKVLLGSRRTDEVGFIVDYGELSFIKDFLDQVWDHRHLNDVAPFNEGVNPTAENMASVLLNLVAYRLIERVDMIEVGVSETPKTWATCQVVAQHNPLPQTGDEA